MPGEAGMPANLPTCRNDARLLGKVTSKSGSTLASSSESQTRGNPLSSRGTWHTNSCLSEHGLSFQSASTAYISPQSSPAPWLSGWLLLQPVKAMSSPSRDSHSKVPSVSMSSYPIQALPAQTRLKFSSLCMNQFSSASLMAASVQGSESEGVFDRQGQDHTRNQEAFSGTDWVWGCHIIEEQSKTEQDRARQSKTEQGQQSKTEQGASS
eukprot:2592743-Rhodomonas_salina.2